MENIIPSLIHYVALKKQVEKLLNLPITRLYNYYLFWWNKEILSILLNVQKTF